MTEERALRTLAVAAAVVVAVLIAWRALAGGQDAPPIQVAGPRASEAAGPGSRASRPKEVWVHVAGAVRRPGVYGLPAGSRAEVALRSAGGPSRRADLAAVNLAAPLSDGQQVLVPARGRAAAPSGRAEGPAAVGAAPGAKLSLSSATQAELEQLDGIGPALARRILEYRDAHGGFRSVGELQQVDGIGEKRLAALSAAVQP